MFVISREDLVDDIPRGIPSNLLCVCVCACVVYVGGCVCGYVSVCVSVRASVLLA